MGESTTHSIQSVAVVGAGAMGAGIAQSAANVGLAVTMIDITEDAVARGTQTIAASLDRFVKSGTLAAADADAARSRVAGTTDFDAARGADIVIEAVFEDEAVKRDLFRRLDATCQPGAILASNTSSISITVLAAATRSPGARHRYAFLQSGAADGTRRDRPGRADERRDA